MFSCECIEVRQLLILLINFVFLSQLLILLINFVFLSQLSHFYALTRKHSTLIYSHSCYSHRFWLPVHTLFSITSLSFVSHFIVSLVRIWRERAKTCLYVHSILVVAMSVQTTRSWVFFGIQGRIVKNIILEIPWSRHVPPMSGKPWKTQIYQSMAMPMMCFHCDRSGIWKDMQDRNTFHFCFSHFSFSLFF